MSSQTPITDATARRTAGIILCGGESRRMRRPKWSLPFGDETLLDRIVHILGAATEAIVIVGPAAGEFPQLKTAETLTTLRARDRQPGLGPLEGLAVGLARAEEAGAEYAFVTACDAPLLRKEFVGRMFELAAGYEAVVPRESKGIHPLAAVYATRLHSRLDAALAAGERRAQALAELSYTRWVAAEDLIDVDPQLLSLRNVNTPEEYAAALAEATAGPD